MSAAERTSDRAFLAVAALLFLGSAALTIRWCASMAAMGEMVMPGGWAMSMTWMRMPGQTWPGAAASFVAMWAAMTAAMMLPSLVPMLRRYRCAAAVGPDRAPAIAALPPSLAVGREMRLGALTALVAAGYFCVWTVLGAAVFAVGAALASLAMRELRWRASCRPRRARWWRSRAGGSSAPGRNGNSPVAGARCRPASPRCAPTRERRGATGFASGCAARLAARASPRRCSRLA